MKSTSEWQWIWRFIAFSFIFGLVLTLNFLDSMHVVFPSVFKFEESVYQRVFEEPYLLVALFVGSVAVDMIIGRLSRSS